MPASARRFRRARTKGHLAGNFLELLKLDVNVSGSLGAPGRTTAGPRGGERADCERKASNLSEL